MSHDSLIQNCTPGQLACHNSRSYGIVVLQTATNSAVVPPMYRNGMVRMGELSPVLTTPPSDKGSFSVELHDFDTKYKWVGGGPVPTNMTVEYFKSYRRISPEKNPIGSAKKFVSQFAGTYEASKLRSRMIAIEKLRGSIVGESFRFPLGEL